MLEQNKDRCYEIINRGDGVYFGVLWPPSRHHDAAGLGVYRSLNKSIQQRQRLSTEVGDVVAGLIDIIRSFSNLALPPHQMAKGAEEFLRLLDNTQEYGHGFDVELLGLNVMNDAFAIIGK